MFCHQSYSWYPERAHLRSKKCVFAFAPILEQFLICSLGSYLRGPISNAIIKLNEMGTIPALKKKWWEKERGGGTCQVQPSKVW